MDSSTEKRPLELCGIKLNDLYSLKKFKADMERKIGKETPTVEEFKLMSLIEEENLTHMPPPLKSAMKKPTNQHTFNIEEACCTTTASAAKPKVTRFAPEHAQWPTYPAADPFSTKRDEPNDVTKTFQSMLPKSSRSGDVSDSKQSREDHRPLSYYFSTPVNPALASLPPLEESKATPMEPHLPPLAAATSQTLLVPPAPIIKEREVIDITEATFESEMRREAELQAEEEDDQRHREQLEYAEQEKKMWGPLTIQRHLNRGLKKWVGAKDIDEQTITPESYDWFHSAIDAAAVTYNLFQMVRGEKEDKEVDPIEFLTKQAEVRATNLHYGVTPERFAAVAQIISRKRLDFVGCKTITDVQKKAVPLIADAIIKYQKEVPLSVRDDSSMPTWALMSMHSLIRIACEVLGIVDLKSFHRAPCDEENAQAWYCHEVHTLYLSCFLRRDKNTFRPSKDAPLRLLCNECFKDEINPGMFNLVDFSVCHLQCFEKQVVRLKQTEVLETWIYFKVQNPYVL